MNSCRQSWVELQEQTCPSAQVVAFPYPNAIFNLRDRAVEMNIIYVRRPGDRNRIAILVSMGTLDRYDRGEIIGLMNMQESVRLDALQLPPATSELGILCIPGHYKASHTSPLDNNVQK